MSRPLFTFAGQRQDTLDTCSSYQRQLSCGGEPTEIVTGLAAHYGVNRPAIWRRLRAGGVLPPYRSNAGLRRFQRRTNAEIESEMVERPRVDRDPCPRCQVRADIGCRHRPIKNLTGWL